MNAIEALRRRIPEDSFTFSFTRGSGPGGQNVNKLATRVTLQFDLKGTTLLTDEEKRMAGRKLATRITKQGCLRVVSSRHRTQRANRRAALERFFELLATALHKPRSRRPTRVPHKERRRRLQDKRTRGQQKRLRSDRPLGDGHS